MKIHKLIGNPHVEAQFISEILNSGEQAVFVLDEKAGALHTYIDNLNLQDTQLYKLKICKELCIDATLIPHQQENEIQINTISQLLAEIDETQRYKLIINNNDRRSLSQVVQQLVYIDLPIENINIMLSREVNDEKKLYRFMSNINELLSSLDNSINMIKSINPRENCSEHKKQILESLNIIKESIEKSKQNELKIAVAATKKTGKSVVVNCMIEDELAPTSLELATPNNCIYKKSPDQDYHLDFNGKRETFSNSSELKQHILDHFKSAQLDVNKNFTIPDMIIYYPTDKNNFSAYTVYDTPGPDLAGAAHHESAQKALDVSDVVIFCIDYTKYLTTSEEEYLRAIKKIFEDKNKYYSLIFIVNKLDERYTSVGDKSITRILDFISSRLNMLGYTDCIVMGTSALQYFSALQAPRIKDCECLQDNNHEDSFKDRLEDCIDQYMGKPEMTILNFVEEQSTRLRRFHGIKCNSLDDIKRYSGIDRLLNYAGYIARSKAVVEKVQHLVQKVDNEYAKLDNFFKLDELEESLKNNKEVLEQVRTILGKFSVQTKALFTESINDYELTEGSTVLSTIKNDTNKLSIELDQIQDYLHCKLKKIRSKDLSQNLSELFSATILGQIESLLEDSKSTVTEQAFRDCLDKCYISSIRTFNERTVPDIYKSCITSYQNYLDRVLEEYKTILNNRISTFKSLADECSEQLENDFSIAFSITVPEFAFEFYKEEVSIDMEKLKEVMDNIGEKVKESILINPKHKLLEKFKGILSFLGANTSPTKYKVSMKQLEDVLSNMSDSVRLSLQNEVLNDFCETTNNQIRSEVATNFKGIKEQLSHFNNTLTDTANMINTHLDNTQEIKENIDDLREKQEFFKEASSNLGEFFNNWKEIRGK